MYPEHYQQFENCTIHLYRRGEKKYAKASYPVRSGVYSVVEADDFSFHFNLNHEIIRIIGKAADWPHPHEWLKRTAGNDWVYYSTGGYTGVFETTGEYYLPNLPYSTNNALGGAPFSNSLINSAIENWHKIMVDLRDTIKNPDRQVLEFLDSVAVRAPGYLAEHADRFISHYGGRISVLPPDTRHVDYNVIPLFLSEGCLYKCRFCTVKNHKPFSINSSSCILEQLERIKQFYGDDLQNYNSVFIGEHDGLNGGADRLLSTIREARDQLGLDGSWCRESNFFLFGSVFALMNSPATLFEELQEIPSNIYINVGLESADQETLDRLGKPLTEQMVIDTFAFIQDINDRYATIEITSNFVVDDALPQRHYQKLISLVRDRVGKQKSKGCIYLSSLRFDAPSRSQLFKFYRLKVQSRLPLFLYTIQRL